MKNKKADVGNLQGFVMSILTITIVLVIGLIVLGQFKDSMGEDISYTSVANESLAYTNNTLDALTYTGFTLACDAVRTINGTTLGTTNYTCATGGITLTNVGGWADDNNDTVYIDYRYKSGNMQYNTTGTNITKLSTVPTWIGIIITVALAFIVLGYFFARRN